MTGPHGRLVGVVATTAGEAGPDPALVVLLLALGLFVTMGGLWLLLGRPRRDHPDVRRSEAVYGLPLEEPPAENTATATTQAAEPCDWELRVDTGDGQPLIVRAALGRPCCTHTIRLTSMLPLGDDQQVEEHFTWSGEQTRITDMVVSSRTRHEVTTIGAVPRCAGVEVTGAIGRGPGPTVSTPWYHVSDDHGTEDGVRIEQLWATHLQTLRERGIRADAEDGPLGLQARVQDRSSLVLAFERGCSQGRHVRTLEAHLTVDAAVSGRGADDAEVHLPIVDAWMEGDVTTRAVTVASASPGVETALGTGSRMGLRMAGSAHPATAMLVGHGRHEADDAGASVSFGTTVDADLSLGPATAEHEDVQLSVTVGQNLRLHVEPMPLGPAGTEDIECACTPAYELRLGELPRHDHVSSPSGRLVVDDRVFVVQRSTDGAGVPRWSVVSADPRRPEEYQDDDRSAPGAGPAPDRRWAGAGQRLDGIAGGADSDAGPGPRRPG